MSGSWATGESNRKYLESNWVFLELPSSNIYWVVFVVAWLWFVVNICSRLHSGESNVYTIGNIGPHRVVSTKLPQIGRQMAAQISSGNTTTRLLGTVRCLCTASILIHTHWLTLDLVRTLDLAICSVFGLSPKFGRSPNEKINFMFWLNFGLSPNFGSSL